MLAAFGDGFIVYLLPLYLKDELGATPGNIGLLYSLSTIAAAITIIPGGFLADRYDRKRILLFSWILWVPIPLTFFFASDWTQLLVPMFVYGITLSGPASSAYILGRSDNKGMASAFTTLGSAFALGYIFSPATAGVITNYLGTRAVFIGTVIFYSLAALVLVLISSQHPLKMKEGENDTEKIIPEPITAFRKLLPILVLFAVMMFAVSLISANVSLFQSDVYSFSDPSILFLGSFTYFGGFVLSYVVGALGDKFGRSLSIAFAMFAMGLSLLLFISWGNFVFQMFVAFLRGASFPMWAYIGLMAGSIAPSDKKARWISFAQTATRVSTVAAPFIGGVLYQTRFELPFFLATSIFLSISVILGFRFLKKRS